MTQTLKGKHRSFIVAFTQLVGCAELLTEEALTPDDAPAEERVLLSDPLAYELLAELARTTDNMLVRLARGSERFECNALSACAELPMGKPGATLGAMLVEEAQKLATLEAEYRAAREAFRHALVFAVASTVRDPSVARMNTGAELFDRLALAAEANIAASREVAS